MRRGSCRYPLPTERPPYPHSLPAVFKRVLRILGLFSGLLPVSCRGTAYRSTPTDCHRCQHFESGRADQRADACMSLRLVIRLQPTCAHSRCRATLRLPRVSPRPLPAVVLQLPRRTGISRLLSLAGACAALWTSAHSTRPDVGRRQQGSICCFARLSGCCRRLCVASLRLT